MAVTFVEQTALTVSSTELSLISGTSTLQADTTACAMQAVIDCSNVAKGDEFVLRVYETTRSGGTKRRVHQVVVSDVQTELLTHHALVVGRGWDVTLQKNAGTDRTFDTSIRKVS